MSKRQLLIIISVGLMIVANIFYAQISELLFNETPDSYGKYYDTQSLISPPVFTFIIWAPIWLSMICFSVYQALPQHLDSELFGRLLMPVIVICFFNGISLYGGYMYNIVILIFLLSGLIWAFLVIQEYKKKSEVSFWFTEFPFSLFFGWITVALIVTITQNLKYFNWEPLVSEQFWLFVMISIASSIALFIYIKFRSVTYYLVFIWAFVGILLTNYNLNLEVTTYFMLVVIILLVSFLLKNEIERKIL